jgi:DNA anti-recombination protein RmuC
MHYINIVAPTNLSVIIQVIAVQAKSLLPVRFTRQVNETVGPLWQSIAVRYRAN